MDGESTTSLRRIQTTTTSKSHIDKMYAWEIDLSPTSKATNRGRGKALICTKSNVLRVICSSSSHQVSMCRIRKYSQHYRAVVMHLQSPPPLSLTSP